MFEVEVEVEKVEAERCMSPLLAAAVGPLEANHDPHASDATMYAMRPRCKMSTAFSYAYLLSRTAARNNVSSCGRVYESPYGHTF